MSHNQFRIPIPKIGFNPPVYYCQRATESLVLDGNLNKSFWNHAPFSDDFMDIEGTSMPVPRFRTRVKMLWDDENLYVGALLEGNEIWANQTEHDCVIFHDNDFEIFIDPDSDTQEYVEFEMNALNTTWDLLLTKAYRDMGSPINGLELKGLKSAVQIHGELNNPSADNISWSVEVVIPFETLNECSSKRRSPVAGEYYRMNFSRVQWLTDIVDHRYVKRLRPGSDQPYPEDNWVWAPTGVINIHYPELWGFVFFCNSSNEIYNIPDEEHIKWDLRLLYYAEHIYKDEHGSFTDSLDVLLEVLSSYSPCLCNKTLYNRDYHIETTSSLFEISTPVPGTNCRLSIYFDGKTAYNTCA